MGLFDRIRGGDDDPRVAFFGIDGVPFSLIDDHRDEFENLAALLDEGSGGAIDSIVPPESSACWPALTSGVNPGETGVYGFQDREVGSYDTYVPMGRDVQTDRLWDRVHQAGRDATVMNVVTTFPPQRDVQRMVSGFLTPAIEKGAYPDELRDHLESIDYRIDTNAGLGHEDKGEFLEDAHETIDKRQEAFEHYIEEDDWDLFFGVFMTTDRVNHFLFRDYEEGGEYEEEFVDFYRKVDRYLGELRDMLPDDVTMVVASDHGFTTLDYEVNCNAWLREQGWLDYDDDTDYTLQLNAWLREEGHLPAGTDEPMEMAELRTTEGVAAYAEADPEDWADLPVDVDGASDGAATVVAYDEATKDDVVDTLESATPETLTGSHGDTTPLVESVDVTVADDEFIITVEPTAVTDLDADREEETDTLEYSHTDLGDIGEDTRAYSLIPGRFYVNLEGREPRGAVPEEEYEAVRAELKAQLENLEGPNGEPVADRVVTSEDAFRGDHDDIAPDLVIVPNHGFDLKAGFKGRKNPFVAAGARNGMHSFDNATLIVDDEAATVEDVDLYDIAPTILDLMDVDYERSEFDGRSIV